MTVVSAYRDGAGRVLRAPLLLAGTLAATLLVAVPLTVALRGMLADHLGSSLEAAKAASGVNWNWWQEFSSQATGLGTTFGPSVIGGAAVLRNLSDLLDNRQLAKVLAGTLAAWLVLWSFLSGGIIDRLARDRRLGAHGFFMAAGTHFFRFLRLGVLAWLAYYVLFAHAHGWLLDVAFSWLTRDFTVERQAFAVRVLLYAVFGALLLAVNLLFDYARIRVVVEDRRSALGAFLAAARFIRRDPAGVVGVYALNAVGFVLLAAAYVVLAPGAGGTGAGQWLALFAGQIWIVARLALKLQFYASQTAFFQGRLAHAGYVAAPVPEWPESPSVEALRRLRDTSAPAVPPDDAATGPPAPAV